MNEWKSIHLKDVGPFGDVTFKIPKGITTIYGANGKSANSNAAGKTLLFSSIFDTLLEVPVAAEKSDRLRTGVRAVSMVLDSGEPLVVKREGSKSSIKHGNAVIRGATKVRKKLDQVSPWTWEDIVSYIHLDSQVPHPLVKGSNTSRKQFLTRFFRLDQIDIEKKIIKAELDKIAPRVRVYEQLKLDVSRTTKQLPPKGLVGRLQKQLQQQTKLLERLQNNSAEHDAARSAALFRDQAAKELNHYLRGRDESGQKHPAKILAFYTDLLQKELAKIPDGERYQEYLEHQERYQTWVDNLSKETIDFLRTGNVEIDPEKRARRCQNAMREVTGLRSTLKELSSTAKQELQPVLEPEIPRGKLQVRLETLQHRLTHAKKFGKGSCPTCGQSVKISNPKQLQSKIDEIQEQLDDWDQYLEYKEQLQQRTVARTEYSAIKKRLQQCKSVIYNNHQYITIANDLQNPVKAPAKYTGKIVNLQITNKLISELQERATALEFLCKHLDVLRIALSDSDPVDSTTLEKAARLSRSVTQIEAKLERASNLQHELRQLRSKMEKLQPIVNRHVRIKKLLEAYDDKAMKKLAIQSVSTQLMAQVNKYAKLAFTDDLRFELLWESQQVQFLVHRHYADRIDTSDVRRLSGAETKLFTIALVLSLLAFVPKNKRSSMIVLDEPTSNMGEANMAIFRELLPVINKLIPSVIIITPKTEERFGGAEYTIQKMKGKTTIRKGHPTMLRKP